MPKRRHQQLSDNEDEDRGDDDFGEQFMTFSQMPPEASQSVLQERASERTNIENLDREAQEKYLSSIGQSQTSKKNEIKIG